MLAMKLTWKNQNSSRPILHGPNIHAGHWILSTSLFATAHPECVKLGLKFQGMEFPRLCPSILIWWHLECPPHNSAWGHFVQDASLFLRLHQALCLCSHHNLGLLLSLDKSQSSRDACHISPFPKMWASQGQGLSLIIFVSPPSGTVANNRWSIKVSSMHEHLNEHIHILNYGISAP